MSDRKPKFRDHLDQFSKEHFGSPISNLNEKQRSDALVLSYLLEIRNALLPSSVPDDFDELQNYISDAQHDRTADFVYRDDNHHVTIIQAKHRNPQRTESEADFDSFRAVLKKLCPETRPKDVKINQQVLDLASDIDWDTDTFTLLFVSLAKHSDPIAKNAEQDLDDILGSPLRDISARSDLMYLSEDEINKEWRDVISGAGASPRVDLLLAKPDQGTPTLLKFKNLSGVESYMGVLSAPQIHQLYNRHREKLFNLNIRNYIGDTRTNKDIIKSAIDESDRFFFYNNGLSAVASKVHVRGNGDSTTLSCEDFSIINGAQTFRSISKAHSRSRVTTKDLRVLIRVSKFDFRRDEGAELLDRITRYNNTQNSMKLSDFRSNDQVQTSLVHYTAEVSAFRGRKYVYRNKRTQSGERNKIIIKMDDFCRAVFAYQFGPIDMSGGQSHLYDTGIEGGYVKLFGHELGPLSQPEFERLFGIWLITSKLDELLKLEKKVEAEGDELAEIRKNALERKFLVFYAAGVVIRDVCRAKKIAEDQFLRPFSKPMWQEEANRMAFIREAFYLATDLVVQAYQMAQTRAGAAFVHRNFFRDAETLRSISSARASRRSQLSKLAEQI